MFPNVPSPLAHTSAEMLEFARLREMVAGYATTGPGREWTLALQPSGDAGWAIIEQQRVSESLRLLRAGPSFDFHGLIDPGDWLDRARIHGAVLEVDELRALSALVGRFRAFQEWQQTLSEELCEQIPSLRELAMPLVESRFAGLVQALDGKFEADGSIADHASPELARIRRQMERQQRAIEESLRSMLRRLGPEGSLQEDLITVRGERFVLPVKAEWKRRVPGVMHGASSSGQTYFIEPIETIEQNNELQRLQEEEQEEEHRILAAMTRQVGEHAEAIRGCATILAEVESLFARARFAADFQCTAPVFSPNGIGADFSEGGAPSAAGKTSARRSPVATILAQPTSRRIQDDRASGPGAARRHAAVDHQWAEHRRQNCGAENCGPAGVDGAGRDSCSRGGGGAAHV